MSFFSARSHLSTTFLLFCFALAGCQGFFYFPNHHLYADPATIGLNYEIVQYPSLNGKKLYGLYFRTNRKPKGTVVHFHGNFGNVSNHFLLSMFLVRNGFDVLIFDYEGYGASEGKPDPAATVRDGIASVRYAKDHLRDPSTGVAVFGQSIGGAVAVVVAAREPIVKAAVIEAAFSSYRSMTRAALGRHIFTWPMYPIAPLFVCRGYDPEAEIARISPRPIFLIHGDRDEIIPCRMSERLYAKAREPKKLWIVPGAGHLALPLSERGRYEKDISDFFTAAIKDSGKG
jgi:fermentation-respiration switch protein FrsA (DUF1100 family)